MNKLTNAQFTQLSFWGMLDEQPLNDKDKPHPIIIAERWNFHLSYYKGDGDPKHYLYHAVQWMQGLGAKSRQSWQDMKNELSDSTLQLKFVTMPYKAANNKTYQVDFITQETCYAVAQEMRLTRTRPQLAEIKTYLAKAGVIIDNIRRGDPETVSRMKARIHGIESRIDTAKVYKATHVTHAPDYAALTNATYHHLFQTQMQMTAKAEIAKELGLTPSQCKGSLRKHLHELALIAIDAAESLAGYQMRLQRRLLSDKEQLAIVAEAARMEAKSYKAKCDWLKINPITGDALEAYRSYSGRN